MFWVVSYVAPYLKTLTWHQEAMLSVVSLLTSVGFFKTLSWLLGLLMSLSGLVRKKVLGAHYMHGTWIGWFIGHSKDKRYMVEYYSQDLDSLSITGQSFNDKLDLHGQWTSDAVTVDIRHGQLVFTYTFDVITNSAPLAGVHTSILERTGPHEAPIALKGFAHDLNDPTRIAVHSIKLSDEFKPLAEALEEAKKRF